MNPWLVAGVIGCGFLGFLTHFLWMRTKSWTTRAVLLFFALLCIGGMAYLMARAPFPVYVYIEKAEGAMAPDWEGVKKIHAELSNAWLTLRPGTGALWMTKRAPTQDHLRSMEVELAREGENLVLRTLPESLPEYADFSLSLEVPVEIEELQVHQRGEYASLKIHGLDLTKIVLVGGSLEVVGGKASSIQMSGGSFLHLTRVEVPEVAAARAFSVELTDPLVPPQGTVLTLGKGRVILRARAPMHVILEAGPGVLVSLPAGVSHRVEELGFGKRWEVGPAELPPITVRMEAGEFRWISP